MKGKVKKFGTITKEGDDLTVTGFRFDGEGHNDPFEVVFNGLIKYFQNELEKHKASTNKKQVISQIFLNNTFGENEMKDEDIKLPEVSGSTFSGESPLWRAILRWHEAKGLSCMAMAIDINDEVKKLMTEYAREAVRLNQSIAPNNQPLPFDLEAAKRGEAIVTRDGRKAEFIAHDIDFDEACQLIIKVDGSASAFNYYSNGKYSSGIKQSVLDLFMAPKPKRVVYLNVYYNGYAVVHSSELSARQSANDGAEIIAHPVELP